MYPTGKRAEGLSITAYVAMLLNLIRGSDQAWMGKIITQTLYAAYFPLVRDKFICLLQSERHTETRRTDPQDDTSRPH
jgi:hypothetical protein